jgi:hypothetical protein
LKEKDKIIKWLKSKPLICIAKLERECRIPQASISNALAGRMERLSDKHSDKLTKTLKDYGYFSNHKKPNQ